MYLNTLNKSFVFFLFLSLTTISFSADNKNAVKEETPTPFGLVFGKTTKEDALNILKKEGASITNSGNRIIKDDISNPYVEGYFFKGVNIDGVVNTKVWFLKGILMGLTYELSGSFQPFNDQLKARYGQPSKSRTDFGGEAYALWSFRDLDLSLIMPFMGGMTMDYSHLKLYRESKVLDSMVYAEVTKAMGKKQKGF